MDVLLYINVSQSKACLKIIIFNEKLFVFLILNPNTKIKEKEAYLQAPSTHIFPVGQGI